MQQIQKACRRIEIGLEKFLTEHDYHAVVTLLWYAWWSQAASGLAIQRLMERAMASVQKVTGRLQQWFAL